MNNIEEVLRKALFEAEQRACEDAAEIGLLRQRVALLEQEVADCLQKDRELAACDDENTAREALKQRGHKLNCRFCRKQFESRELLINHQTHWKDCISKKTREYILFNDY
jgi:hypothetical protein